MISCPHLLFQRRQINKETRTTARLWDELITTPKKKHLILFSCAVLSHKNTLMLRWLRKVVASTFLSSGQFLTTVHPYPGWQETPYNGGNPGESLDECNPPQYETIRHKVKWLPKAKRLFPVQVMLIGPFHFFSAFLLGGWFSRKKRPAQLYFSNVQLVKLQGIIAHYFSTRQRDEERPYSSHALERTTTIRYFLPRIIPNLDWRHTEELAREFLRSANGQAVIYGHRHTWYAWVRVLGPVWQPLTKRHA